MKISLNQLRFINQRYGSAGDPALHGLDDLVQKIGAQLGAVEEVISFGKKYEGVVVVKVVSVADHPDADRLHVCKIDDGGRAQGVERDDQGLVQVVCGAPNVREGMLTAWLPPGVTVPSTYDADPFVLEARALRGVVSNGMLASPKELALSDSHEGILDIDQYVEPGTPFAEGFNVQDDVVIDMENKMFTHRPDCFGWLGIAREIEGIYHRPYKSPEWYRTNPDIPGVEAEELTLEFRNELPDLVPRFTAITMRDVHVGPSPVWLQARLASVGLRPINNIVDYTNLFMLETGQPMHAYDYDKVMAQDAGSDHARIVVRHPRPGEKILLLNGKEIEPRSEAIMIASRDKLIGVGGVMGGADTEVDENTRNIIIESANFDMYSIRRTAMAHGLFTDAVTRFNKGQSPLQNLAALGKMVSEVREYAGGKVAGQLIDDNHLPAEVVQRGSVYPPVTVSRDFINVRLGLDLAIDEIRSLLTNVEFSVEVQGDELTVTAPFWRTDIEIKEDVVEEVGRLYGFDRLPLELPQRTLTPASKNPMLELKKRLRDALSRMGANEILSYSFVHGNLLDKVGQDKAKAYRLSNALSPDLQYYRLSLTPSLLERVHPNLKAGYDEFALFEIGKVHNKDVTEEGLPKEFDRVALVFAAGQKAAGAYGGAAYYQARVYLDSILLSLGVSAPITLEPLAHSDDEATAYYEPGRVATIKVGDTVIGRIGEYKASVRKALKLPDFCAGLELGLAPLLAIKPGQAYVALPRFPKVEQDITLRVPSDVPYAIVQQFVDEHVSQNRPEDTLTTIGPIDIYQSPEDPARKNITLRLSIASYERTLVAEEVNKLLDDAAVAAHEQFGAERI